jgi:hypothetical protein
MTPGKPAYAVVQLSHLGKPHYPGDRIDEIIPDEIVAGCVERGEATFTKPKATRDQQPDVGADVEVDVAVPNPARSF